MNTTRRIFSDFSIASAASKKRSTACLRPAGLLALDSVISRLGVIATQCARSSTRR